MQSNKMSDLFGDSDEDINDGEQVLTRQATLEPGVATVAVPSIDGLYLFRDLISPDVQEVTIQAISSAGALSFKHPQAMIFPRYSSSNKDTHNCPLYLTDLLHHLKSLLFPLLPTHDFDTVFDEDQPLQTILNLYEPGQGIAPHVRNSVDVVQQKLPLISGSG